MTKSAFSECPTCGEPMAESCPCTPKMPSINNLVNFCAELAERVEDMEPMMDGLTRTHLRNARLDADEQIAAWQEFIRLGGKVVQGD